LQTKKWLTVRHLKPLSIYEQHVAAKSFEPDVLYKGGLVLAANGKKREAKNLFEECLDASYELGPLMTAEIKAGLKNL
jgi:hypothetical protein